MQMWTFDNKRHIEGFIDTEIVKKFGWNNMQISIYKSEINSYGPAELVLQSVEDFYKFK